MTKQERAADLFRQGYGCAQAIAGAFCEELGVSLEKALEISCAFGAGFALSRGTCGAVSAMGMVAGAVIGDHSPQAKKEVYAQVKELSARFARRFQTVICAELLKDVTRKSSEHPVERDAQYYKERPCAILVAFAAEELDKWINDHKDGRN